jgi:hypothetical protein
LETPYVAMARSASTILSSMKVSILRIRNSLASSSDMPGQGYRPRLVRRVTLREKGGRRRRRRRMRGTLGLGYLTLDVIDGVAHRDGMRSTIGQELDLRLEVRFQRTVQGRARRCLEVSNHLQVVPAAVAEGEIKKEKKMERRKRGTTSQWGKGELATFLKAVSMATHRELEPATVPLAYLRPRLTIAG